MTKILFFLLLISCNLAFTQIREFYSGMSLSYYFWLPPHSELNQFKYSTGFQLGYMASPKMKIFRFLTSNRISPYSAVEYSNSNLLLSSGNKIQLHSIRGSFPVRITLINDKNKLKSINAFIEPGVNLNFFQQNFSRNELNFRIKSLNCFMNVGLGTSIHKKPKKAEKSGYKFTGISIYANKYIPVNVMKIFNSNATGIMDQVRINVGIRFSYQEATKKGWIKKNNSKMN
jgi:hypothetical protein